MTRRQHKKEQRKTYYGNQQQHKQHKDQQNNYNKKYRDFKQETSELTHVMTWTWLKKENLEG